MSRKKKQYRSIDAAWDDGTTANQTEHINRLMWAFSAAFSCSDAVDIQTKQVVTTADECRRAIEADLRNRLSETVFVDSMPTSDRIDPPAASEASD